MLARKPLDGTVAANVSKWGTGGLNIDGCRIETSDGYATNCVTQGVNTARTSFAPAVAPRTFAPSQAGRWPANVLLDEDAARELDRQSGVRKSGAWTGKRNTPKTKNTFGAFVGDSSRETPREASEGGASRFFYVAKASRSERDRGCGNPPVLSRAAATGRKEGAAGAENPRAGAGSRGGSRNHHPTVKPVELMRYLVRLVTPPGGLVLDPFMGSGTTGIAAWTEHLRFLGIDSSPEYLDIARARLERARINGANLALPFDSADDGPPSGPGAAP